MKGPGGKRGTLAPMRYLNRILLGHPGEAVLFRNWARGGLPLKIEVTYMLTMRYAMCSSRWYALMLHGYGVLLRCLDGRQRLQSETITEIAPVLHAQASPGTSQNIYIKYISASYR
jgi:hypothetical protein